VSTHRKSDDSKVAREHGRPQFHSQHRQSIKVLTLTLKLIELPGDVIQNTLNLGDGNILQRIDTTVRHLQGLVQGHEAGLQTGQLDEHLHKVGKLVPDVLNFLTAADEAEGLVVGRGAGLVQGEDGDLDAGDVVDAGPDPDPGRHGTLGHLVLEVARGILGLGQREEGRGGVRRHVGLGLGNCFGIVTEFYLRRKAACGEVDINKQAYE